MDKVKALEFLEKASNRDITTRVLTLCERDKNENFLAYLFSLGYKCKDKDTNYLLWLAYWLGREHGEQRLINNARIEVKRCLDGKNRKSLDRILLSALTDYLDI